MLVPFRSRLASPARAAPARGAPVPDPERSLRDVCDLIEADLQWTLAQTLATNDAVSDEARRAGEALDRVAGEAGEVAALAERCREHGAGIASAIGRLAASGEEIARQAGHARAVADRAGAAAGTAGGRLRELDEAVRSIGSCVELIRGVASRTNLLALNAAIEAARAGPAGKGFAVVAQEVKALCGQTEQATHAIVGQLAAVVRAMDASLAGLGEVSDVVAEIGGAAASVAAAVERQAAANREIGERAGANAALADRLATSMAAVSRDTAAARELANGVPARVRAAAAETQELGRRVVIGLRQNRGGNRRADRRQPVALPCSVTVDGRRRATRTVDLSERGALVATPEDRPPPPPRGADATLELDGIGRFAAKVVGSSEAGWHMLIGAGADEASRAALEARLAALRAEDAPLVELARRTAAEIEAALDRVLAAGRTTESVLFDPDYRPVPGTDPLQLTTAALPLLEELLPPIQERALEGDPRIVFCAAVDRNGYLPVHNRAYSQPQRPGDPVWNAAHSRNRRVFEDRAGLAAARTTHDVLIQAYARDMGGGRTVAMKEVDVPIRVADRHWGALRLAFRH
jgi:hypothetical protein